MVTNKKWVDYQNIFRKDNTKYQTKLYIIIQIIENQTIRPSLSRFALVQNFFLGKPYEHVRLLLVLQQYQT